MARQWPSVRGRVPQFSTAKRSKRRLRELSKTAGSEMNFLSKFRLFLSAPLERFNGASRAQNGAPLKKSPKGIAPKARRFGNGAQLAQIPEALGDLASAMANSELPSHERQSGMVVCDWCGAVTRPVAVHGHEQCGRCHRVLNECCNGEVCDGIPI